MQSYFVHGIIPAGAGLTEPEKLVWQHGRDHPRGCGAHNGNSLLNAATLGSSPRVRGSRQDGLVVEVLDGIIPAGAGLTCLLAELSTILRDHPRGCGAHRCAQDVVRT